MCRRLYTRPYSPDSVYKAHDTPFKNSDQPYGITSFFCNSRTLRVATSGTRHRNIPEHSVIRSRFNRIPSMSLLNGTYFLYLRCAGGLGRACCQSFSCRPRVKPSACTWRTLVCREPLARRTERRSFCSGFQKTISDMLSEAAAIGMTLSMTPKRLPCRGN